MVVYNTLDEKQQFYRLWGDVKATPYSHFQELQGTKVFLLQ